MDKPPKKRKGFRTIVVGDETWQYKVINRDEVVAFRQSDRKNARESIQNIVGMTDEEWKDWFQAGMSDEEWAYEVDHMSALRLVGGELGGPKREPILGPKHIAEWLSKV